MYYGSDADEPRVDATHALQTFEAKWLAHMQRDGKYQLRAWAGAVRGEHAPDGQLDDDTHQPQ